MNDLESPLMRTAKTRYLIPVTKTGIRVDAENRLEALVWKLRVNILFVAAPITIN